MLNRVNDPHFRRRRRMTKTHDGREHGRIAAPFGRHEGATSDVHMYLFDERLRRRWAAVEARLMGRGGITCVAAATGMSRTTIRAGLKELDAKQAPRCRTRCGALAARAASR